MEKTVHITINELRTAFENWLDFHYGLHCEEVEERFFKYCHSLAQSQIDDSLDWDNGRETYQVSADTAHNVKLLNSPHHHAVIKAYYAKHPWKQPNV